MKYAVIKDGQVVNVIFWDGVDEAPEPVEGEPAYVPFRERFDGAALFELPDDSIVAPGWTYDGSKFIAPEVPPMPPMTAVQATAERDRLMAYATTQIAPLQDAVDMEEATPAEVAALTAWKKYRLAVSRTSTSAGWPGAVEWPPLPA